jgi:hypothetical protein
MRSRPDVRSLLTLLVATAAAAVLVVVTSGSAAAATDATITGSVTPGVDEVTVDEVTVDEVAVTLLLVDQDGEREVDATVTDAEGRFAFEGLDADESYEVVVGYDDATYRSGLVRFDEDGAASVGIEVFPSTDDPADVVVTSWVVWVDGGNGVAVQQDLQIDNRGTTTYLGSSPDAGGVRAVVSVPLAPNAMGLRFLGLFTECCAEMRGTDYVHTTPLPPGRVVGTVRYSTESLTDLEFPVRLPVESFTLMAPLDVTVSSSWLERSGEIESQGNSYLVYTAESLPVGDVLTVGLRGLSVPATPVWQLALAAAGGVVLFGSLVAMVVLRRRGAGRAGARLSRAAWVRSRGSSDGRGDVDGGGGGGRRDADGGGRDGVEAGSGAVVGGAEGGGSVDVVAPMRTELLVEELALLDVGFERGLIDAASYEALRAARKAELLRSMAATAPR